MKIKLIILAICTLFSLPSFSAINENIGIYIYSYYPPYIKNYGESKTAVISGILDQGYRVKEINNFPLKGNCNEVTVNNLINGKDLYVFTLSYYGDIYVYDFFSDRTSIALLFGNYLNELPKQIFSANSVDAKMIENRKAQITYDNYYDIDYDNLAITDKKLTWGTKREYKKANENEYKKITEIKKHSKAKRYTDAIELDNDFIPIYLHMYQQSLEDHRYGTTLYALNRLKEINKTENLFNEKIINYKLGLLYLMFCQYDKALEYLREFAEYAPATDNQYLSLALSCSHFHSGNFSTSIFYAEHVKPDSKYYLEALDIIIKCYQKLNNNSKTKEYIIKMINVNPKEEFYIKYAETCTDKKEKLDWYYKARKLYYSNTANSSIIKIEQEKIDNSIKNSKSFIEVPNWNKYYRMLRSMSYNNGYIYELQDEFFQKSNNCISRYKGTDLSKCFASLIKEYDDIIMVNQNEYNLNKQKQMQSDYIDELRRIRQNMDSLSH